MKRNSFALTAMLSLAFASMAHAGAFNIYEMSARATSLGGAFTATADDPSAIFYNPAGLAWQRADWSFSLNVSPLKPSIASARANGPTAVEFPGAENGMTKGSFFFPTGAYLGHRINEKFSAGLGFFTPFGLGVEWEDPDSFAGRGASTNAQLQGLYFSPVVAYRPVAEFAFSVGAHFVKTNLDLDRIITANLGTGTDVTNVADVALEGTGNWTAGLAFGAMYRPNHKLSIGVNYKQGVTNKFEQDDATFTQRASGFASVDAQVAGLLTALVGGEGTQEVSAELDYPDIFVLGGRYDFTRKFALMADLVFVGWDVFDEIVLDFENAPTTTLEENYKSVMQFRAGGEYQYDDQLSFMVGYVHDETPQPEESMSPLLPDASRNDYSLGASWMTADGRNEFTVGYMYVNFDERSTVINGERTALDGFDANYESNVNIFSFGYTRNF